ncbi:Aste57867_23186 [Aphanomyces stellatus]|uniref:Aste57867_23186 protein n=1 Tax=Aphanomyces stellatus TaxID=120398 RepID=A0A485LM41_9STRA|nr:hypothetical protein As57867_023115 [Aphanomyces stellatus]VFT99833.1 Aste57867_23186 [Aphanomyces stellatus]
MFLLALFVPSFALLTREECAGVRACTREMNPMCGSDGKTYDNPCLFRYGQCDNPKLTLSALGSCDAPEVKCPSGPCGYSYFPVCASDGVTYANDCEFRRAKCANQSLSVVNAHGACSDATPKSKEASKDSCDFACIALWDPVCGTDGTTYGNDCQLDAEKCRQGPSSTLRQAHKGECSDKLVHHRDSSHESL